MSSEFSNEFTCIFKGHGDTVTSLVCGENPEGSILLLSWFRDKYKIQ